MIIAACSKQDTAGTNIAKQVLNSYTFKKDDQVLQKILQGRFSQVELEGSGEGQKLFDDFVDPPDFF